MKAGSLQTCRYWLSAGCLGLMLVIANEPAQAAEPVNQALSCETRGDYIESLLEHEDPLRQRLGRLFAEPDTQFCRTIRVRVSSERDVSWNWSLPNLSALAWLMRGAAVLLLLIGLIWLALNWRRAGPVLARSQLSSPASAPSIRSSNQVEAQPRDIPAAALAAWSAGNTRLALSLLYRGAVNALVPEKSAHSATESEVLRAIESKAGPTETQAWMQQLVKAWQRTAWASQVPSESEFQALHQAWSRHCGRLRT